MVGVIEKSKHKQYVQINRDGKIFYQLREVGSDKIEEEIESFGIKYLDQLAATNFNSKQTAFFKYQRDNAKLCHIEKLKNIAKNIDTNNPRLKQCYRNSVEVVLRNQNQNIKYCEGYMFFQGIPIEHSWNKIGDRYFDVTAEGPLKKLDTSKNEYISVMEIDSVELSKYLIETEQYGPFIVDKFLSSQKDQSNTDQ